MFNTVLIANRGEIALRVMRACKERGLRTVAVYSEADRDAEHVRYADAAFLLGAAPAAESYLSIPKLLSAARESGAGAIHPGYGFLAENAAFARACSDAGFVFIGPPASAMERMGGKTAARREAQAAGVPVVPGTMQAVGSPAEVLELGREYGFPIAIKAVGGGGGRGFRVVLTASDAVHAFESARREAEVGFGNPEVYVEKYLTDPRHIEIQILADMHGSVIHLGERECSIQRRHQKLIEECPSPAISPELRAEMGAAAVALARAVGYVSAGTLEFMLQDGRYYFLEMNTRIQVEHTVTEMVTGVDLVQAQIRIAQGEQLWLDQADVQWRGHAIECRINAEDPGANFRPALGVLEEYAEPTGYGVRVDSGVRAGWAIPQNYDSLIAKLITWGATRSEANGRMLRALADYRIHGPITTIAFHRLALAHAAFQRGETTVNFIPRYMAEALAELGAGIAVPATPEANGAARDLTVEVNGRRFAVRVFGADLAAPSASSAKGRSNGNARPSARRIAAPAADGVFSVLQGTLSAIMAEPGQMVSAGQVLFVVEAMKMENEVAAPHAGRIGELRVAKGQSVEPGMLLATFEAA